MHDQNDVTDDVETAWTHIKNIIITVSEEILGSEQGGKQENWFRENEANETNIKFDGEPLAVVQRFTYLGSADNERPNLNCEIRSMINAASRAFWKLRE